MISEALRLKPIRQVFTGLFGNKSLTACTCGTKNGAWPPSSETTGLETVGIKNANHALKKVDLLRRPKEIMIDISIY